jgi:hypothetical protein
MRMGVAMLMGLIVPAATLPLLDAQERSNTERVPFAAGGTIHVTGSYGYLTVEGWDEPEVEIAVIKSAGQEQRQDRVRVVTERRSDKELTISTVPPVRKSLFRSVVFVARPLLTNERRGVVVEYRIRVPRDSKLVVHQDNGYVWVSDISGDMEVDSHTGDMIVMLPDPGPYAIDARTRIGSVSSDFAGKGNKQFLVGTHFTSSSHSRPRQIHLRMGRGCITIKNAASSGALEKN